MARKDRWLDYYFREVTLATNVWCCWMVIINAEGVHHQLNLFESFFKHSQFCTVIIKSWAAIVLERLQWIIVIFCTESRCVWEYIMAAQMSGDVVKEGIPSISLNDKFITVWCVWIWHTFANHMFSFHSRQPSMSNPTSTSVTYQLPFVDTIDKLIIFNRTLHDHMSLVKVLPLWKLPA